MQVRTSNAPTNCDICNEQLSQIDILRQEGRDYHHCGSHQCKYLIDKKGYMPLKQWKLHIHHNRLAMHSEKARNEKQQKQVIVVDAKEKQEHEQVTKYVSNKYSSRSDKTLLVSLPSGPSAISLLPNDRRENYIEFLKQSMTESISRETLAAHKEDNEEPQNFPAESIKTPDFCSICKGGCCTMGKNKAYISAETLSQKSAVYPDLSPNEIIDKYISFIPSTSVSDSCINHGTAGCTIPREWRSDTCNRFFCDSLKNYYKQLKTSHQPKDTTIVQRSCTHWNRYGLDQKSRVTKIIYFQASNKSSDTISLDVLNESPL